MKKIFYLIAPLFLLCSCEEILMEDDISNKTVTLVAPTDNAEFFSTGITFTWEAVEFVSDYRIQIARPNFEAPLQIITDIVVDTTSFTTQLNIGEYQWRVQAVNSAYSSPFSTRSFVILSNEDFQNNSVALTSPANNLLTNTSSHNLTWESVIGASSYQVVITDSQNNIISDQEITTTNFNYNFDDGSYQWKVRAGNGEAYTLYSSRSLFIDTTAPNTPVLVFPANASSSTENDITFQWNRTPIEGSAEKDSIYIFKNSELTLLEHKDEQTSPFTMSSLSNGTYYWYVKSFDEAGNSSQQSTVFSFTLN
ncbi:fibronectin type III domain-containing protein [Flavobacterium beibuense]|nr:fibronectin type III domain-containing protein [Flavobacterium beibuense]